MAPSLQSKAKHSGPRFCDGLREEFKLRMKSTKPRRIHSYLGGLKLEFELMAEDINSLRNERDKLEAKVELQAKKLRKIRRNFVCERCNNGPTTADALPLLRANSLSARHILQSKSLEKSGPWRGGIPSRKRRTGWSTRRMTLIRKLKSTTSPSRPLDNLPTPSSHVSPLSANPNRKPCEWSITFNDKVRKELDLEMAHVLSHEDTIWCVKFSQNGKYLAAGSGDGMAYIHNARTGILTYVLKDLLLEKADIITAVCFSHDGKYLATGSWDGGCYIWEISTRYRRNAFKGHTRQINSLDFSPNDQLLVSASDDNTVRLWKMRGGVATVLTEGEPTMLGYISAVFSPDGSYVVASHNDGMIRIWSVRTGQLLRRVKAHKECVYEVAWMPDGEGLVSASWDSTLKYWDVGSLEVTGQSQREVDEQTQPARKFSGHTRSVYSLSISCDSRWIASGSSDRSVRIWDTQTATVQCVLGHDDRIWTVDFSPAGGYLASGGGNGSVGIWRYSRSEGLAS